MVDYFLLQTAPGFVSSCQGFVARWFGFGLVAAPADIPFSSARVGIHGSVGTLVIAWQSAG